MDTPVSASHALHPADSVWAGRVRALRKLLLLPAAAIVVGLAADALGALGARGGTWLRVSVLAAIIASALAIIRYLANWESDKRRQRFLAGLDSTLKSAEEATMALAVNRKDQSL